MYKFNSKRKIYYLCGIENRETFKNITHKKKNDIQPVDLLKQKYNVQTEVVKFLCKILTNYNIYTSSTLKNTGTCNNKDGILDIFKYFLKVQDNCFIIAEKYFSRYLYN